MLDTVRSIPTPEGIELALKVAGPLPRAKAWIIDLLVRLAILFACAMALGALGKAGTAMITLLWFALEWGYPILFEVLWRGQTPGKRSANLRVLHEDGTPIQWRASVARNLLRAVDFLPFLYGFAVVSMMLSRDFKRLGDHAAGTIVVHLEPKRAGRGVPAAEPEVPTAALTFAEQRAFIDFAERHHTWSTERANELAAHAEAVLPAMPRVYVRDSATRALEVANYLVGRTGTRASADSDAAGRQTRNAA
jgi:uncharacterized RDD family membrane protein YckC